MKSKLANNLKENLHRVTKENFCKAIEGLYVTKIEIYRFVRSFTIVADCLEYRINRGDSTRKATVNGDKIEFTYGQCFNIPDDESLIGCYAYKNSLGIPFLVCGYYVQNNGVNDKEFCVFSIGKEVN